MLFPTLLVAAVVHCAWRRAGASDTLHGWATFGEVYQDEFRHCGGVVRVP